MRSRLRVLVGKHFFNYRYDYREEWLRFTAMLSAKSSPREMGACHPRMADMVESPSGALWTQEPGGREYVQTARWNSPASTDREPVDSSLCQFLLRTGWIVELERYRAGTEHYRGLDPAALAGLCQRTWLAVPLLVGDELLGFVTLGPARTPVDINWEVTDLLKTASRQAAGFLAQMLTTEALLEARKFDAFNRMSAFVVHDLKNIVAQLSLMLSNAKRLHANPEFQQDMMATVEHSLEKMRQLMLQLREGEAPAAGRSGRRPGADRAPTSRSVVTRRGRTIDVQVIDAVVTRGHEAGSRASSATSCRMRSTPPRAKTRSGSGSAGSSGQAQVEVGDTGQRHVAGISCRRRCSSRSSTTKEAGLGIGAYESYQYVRELGGSVSVDSEPGRGTVMSICAAAVRGARGVGSARCRARNERDKLPPLLIVEDDLALQKQIKWSLDRFETVAASDRESALVQCRRHAPAVVTMDLGLPPDPDSVSEGFRLLEELLGIDPDIKVIVSPARTTRPTPFARSRLAPTTSSPSPSTPNCSA